jgi:glycosyltransferase involved in cell wall biosynthesis
MGANTILPIKVLPLPVNIEKFKPVEKIKKDKVFIYFKRREPEELEFLKRELDKRNIEYIIFHYIKRYKEEDYLKYLQESKYGIILGAHESQGFAIEEALSCNVPLLVWSATTMNKEYGSSFEAIPCTSVPYWDERCGEIFYKQEEWETKFDEFISKLNTYKPREYVLENLSVEKCAEKWNSLISSI